MDQISRRKLPHWYRQGYVHFVTFRLFCSLSQDALDRWRRQRDAMKQRPIPEGWSADAHRCRLQREVFGRYDSLLDRAIGVRWLAYDAVATVVQENLYRHHAMRYELIAYCIMPNHVHVLLQPLEDATRITSISPRPERISDNALILDEIRDSKSPLHKIMHGIKSFTANRANRILQRTGQFWQHESYDHWVRDLDELQRIVDYIRQNPVRAGLCQSPTQWRWSSCADRFYIDGSDCGLVGTVREKWWLPSE